MKVTFTQPWRSLLMLGCAMSVACASVHRPEVVPFADPAQGAPADWEATFARPTDLKVYALFTGRIKVNRSLLLNIADPRIRDGEDREMWVPVMAFLIRHPEKGDVLVDTGLDSSFARRRGGNFGRLARLVRIFEQAEGQDTVSLLRMAGVEPDRLKMILVSHPHGDHTAGLPELPKSVRVVAGPDFLSGYESLWYAPINHLKGYERIETLDFTNVEETGPGRAIDLFGDGSLFVISTPGHAPGNLSFLLNRTKGPVLLTCDASHTREGFLHGVGPGLVENREQADATVQRLAAFLREYPRASFKAGHDLLDWDAEQHVFLLD